MAFVANTIPNLVSGVSQQSSSSRLKTSGEQMVNAFPSVVSGLIKRPPSEFIRELSPNMAVSDTAAVHMINRETTEGNAFTICSPDVFRREDDDC